MTKSEGAIHSTNITGNFGPKLNGSVRSNRKSFEKMGPPFEVDHFSRSDRLEFWLNGSRPEYTSLDPLFLLKFGKAKCKHFFVPNIALSESAKVYQISSLPRFRYRSYHIVGKFIGFWEERRLLWKLKGSRLRRCLNLATNISRIIRIARNTCGCRESPFAGECSRKSYASC